MLVYDKSCCIERGIYIVVFFFFNDTATTEIYTLSLHDALPIFGITVTQGNRPLKNCVENTLRALDMLDSHIPVYGGCPDAMVRNMIPGRNANNPTDGISLFENGVEYTIHPEYLELPPAVSKAQTKHACSFIIDAVKKSREKISIITVAPPTNIGMAFRMDPTIKDNIEEVDRKSTRLN